MKYRLLSLLLLALLSLTPLRADTKFETRALRGDEAPTARAYLNWILRDIHEIEGDLPQITAAAELAADPFLAGKNLGVRGAIGLNEELGGRSGGFVIYRSTPGQPGDVIVYAFGVTTAKSPDPRRLLETELADAEKLRAGGSVVVGIASFKQLESLHLLDQAKKTCSALLDNHAPASDGLFRDKAGHAEIPTFVVADPIVAWTWCGELFAACTRRGKTPAMYQSVMVDTKMVRFKKYENQQFHTDLHVDPQPAGKIGGAYLRGLRSDLNDIGTTSWTQLAAVADRAAGVIEDGGKTYLYTFGHYPPYHNPGTLAHDPAIFTKLDAGPGPGLADDVVAIGYCMPPGFKGAWGDLDKLRGAGRGVAWVAAGFDFQASDMLPNEILVDQQWGRGDAVVSVPGYDVRILPPSGVTSEAIMWMITAQAWTEVEEYNAAVVKRK